MPATLAISPRRQKNPTSHEQRAPHLRPPSRPAGRQKPRGGGGGGQAACMRVGMQELRAGRLLLAPLLPSGGPWNVLAAVNNIDMICTDL
jgi:hypothetical protein